MRTLKDLDEGCTLFFNKPIGWTSFDVVNKVRLMYKHTTGKNLKVGHAGTLDPLATGLLIVCTGKETKNIQKYQLMEKEYAGTMTLGAITASYDLETPVEQKQVNVLIDETEAHQAAKHFTGKILQKPPLFSAKRINGKRAYKSARKNKKIDIPPVEVEIKLFDITKFCLPEIEFRVICSKGTYIRSLANDFGDFVGCGAYLAALIRTRIGDFSLKNAMEIDDWEI